MLPFRAALLLPAIVICTGNWHIVVIYEINKYVILAKEAIPVEKDYLKLGKLKQRNCTH